MAVGMKILYRQIIEIPAKNWSRFLENEKKMDDAEARFGYPFPRKYRQLFGASHSDTVRVYERQFDSYSEFGKLMEARQNNPVLKDLDKERQILSLSANDTYYYVDSGSPVYPLLWKMSRVPFTEEELLCASNEYDSVSLCRELIEENTNAGKLRVLHRRTQMIPLDRWIEHLRMEKKCDAVESEAQIPLPTRYRSGPGTNGISYMRITQREYSSISDLLCNMDNVINEVDDNHRKIMDCEVERNEFFDWEQDEILVVDSDSFTPLWMTYAADI